MYTDEFMQFWKAYPRHTAKAAAFKAWSKLKPDAAMIEMIAQALIKQRYSDQWLSGPQFIPHASTWLNQRRWEDEMPQSKKEAEIVASRSPVLPYARCSLCNKEIKTTRGKDLRIPCNACMEMEEARR